MDTTTTVPQPDIEPPSTPNSQIPIKKSKRPLIIALTVFLALAIGAGSYFLGTLSSSQNTNVEQPDTADATPENWQMLVSGKKGFPIPNNGMGGSLTYYSMEQTKTITLDDIKLGNSGGAAGLGNGDAIASPNLNFIAFIGEDGNLWLFSVETEKTQQLTTNGLVTYITDWSPDSKKILYYYERRTVESSGAVIDAPVPSSSSFKPQIEQGFYQINIETGGVTPLAPIELTEGYIDNKTLLVKENYESENLVSFDIDALTASRNITETKAGFGVGQFDFSSDGKMWTYLDTMNKTDPTEGKTAIVLGNYPNKATTTIDSGNWASVQRPIFSPDNKLVAYQKSAGSVEGVPQNHVWIYDIASQTKTDTTEGTPVHWVDNKTVLVQGLSSGGSKPSFVLLNIETKQTTPIDY